MTNLLPPDGIRSVQIQYWSRVGLVWLGIWTVCILVSITTMLPTYVLLLGTSQAYTDQDTASMTQTASASELRRMLFDATNQADLVAEVSNRTSVSSYIDDILRITDQYDVVVGTLNVSYDAENNLRPITVSGIANDRESLASMRRELVGLPYVTDIELPIDNLARRDELPFQLTLENNPAPEPVYESQE